MLQFSNCPCPFHSPANLFALASAPPELAEIAARAAWWAAVYQLLLRLIVFLRAVAQSDGPALAAESKAVDTWVVAPPGTSAVDNPDAEGAADNTVGGNPGSILARRPRQYGFPI